VAETQFQNIPLGTQLTHLWFEIHPGLESDTDCLQKPELHVRRSQTLGDLPRFMEHDGKGKDEPLILPKPWGMAQWIWFWDWSHKGIGQ
jgi:hypothetical protein